MLIFEQQCQIKYLHLMHTSKWLRFRNHRYYLGYRTIRCPVTQDNSKGFFAYCEKSFARSSPTISGLRSCSLSAMSSPTCSSVMPSSEGRGGRESSSPASGSRQGLRYYEIIIIMRIFRNRNRTYPMCFRIVIPFFLNYVSLVFLMDNQVSCIHSV